MAAVRSQHFTSTNELLDAVKAQRGFTSDYQLAKHMGWTTSRLGNYRSGRSVPSDEVAGAIAAELKRSPLYVLAVMRADSERNAQLKELWLSFVRSARIACVVGAMGIGAALAPPPAHASTAELSAGSVYYVV